jgi:polyketide synthase 12/myxalamid-type polyketide synthase MxaB
VIADAADLVSHLSPDAVADQPVPTDVVFLRTLDDKPDSQTPCQSALQLNDALLQTVQAVARWRSQAVAAGEVAASELRFWVVTQGAQDRSNDDESSISQASVWGFARTLALEHQDWQTHLIDLDPKVDDAAAVQTLVDEVTCGHEDAEQEVIFRRGQRLARRLQQGFGQQSAGNRDQSMSLQIANRGTLEGLELRSQPRAAPGPNEIEVAVRASGLNFRDVLNVLGQYPGEPPLGAECSGLVTRIGSEVHDLRIGDRVLVVAPNTFCDFLLVDQSLAIVLPDELSLADAATLPVAFLTASIALEQIGKLGAGQRVLIHAATGGVGLAAMQLARAAGAEIFATASQPKHEKLRELGIQHVFDSRKPGFAHHILAATAGQGVDVVLNALGSEFIEENVQALAQGGRYIDIAKGADVQASPAFAARSDLTYEAVDLAQLLRDRPELIQSQLSSIVARVVQRQLRPLPARRFELTEAKSAFRFMRAARHIGKLLLCPARADDPGEAARVSPNEKDPCPSCLRIRDDRSYLITGGLGGLGLALAHWLAQQGARHIGLLARRQPRAEEQAAIDRITSSGVTVELLEANVERWKEVSEARAKLYENNPPLAGVFHLAGRLDDGLILRQTTQQFSHVLGPKARGAWNLHRATLDDQLDHFVLFSSVSSVLGSAGQANHAAANAFLDGLARYRQAQKLPALSINWGPWSEIGAAARRDVGNRDDLSGIGMLTPAEGLSLLARALNCDAPQVAALRLNVEQLPTRWRQRTLFERLEKCSADASSNGDHDSDFLRQYRQAADDQRQSLLLAHLQSLVANTLGMPSPNSVAVDQALSDMGLDSLASLELGNNLEESLNVAIPSTLVYDYPTLHDMADFFAGRLADATPSVEHAPPSETTPAETRSTEESDDTEDPDHSSSSSEDDSESDDVLKNIQDLSDELERWDEV